MNQLRLFVRYRLKSHAKHLVFWLYFSMIVCGVGGMGIWSNFFKPLVNWDWSLVVGKNIATSMYTFFPALTISSLADIILPEKIGRTVRMAALALLLLSIFLLFLCISIPLAASIICSSIGCIISLFVWVIAHGEDSLLSDDVPMPQNAIGGAEDKPVSGSEGNYDL